MSTAEVKDETVGDIIDVLLYNQKKSRNTKRAKTVEMIIPSWEHLNKEAFVKAMKDNGFGTWATIDSKDRQRLQVCFPPKSP